MLLLLIFIYVPWQDPMMQYFSWDVEPRHSRPPYDGLGLLQERDLVCVPKPHALVQDVQEAHIPHFPSTVYK